MKHLSLKVRVAATVIVSTTLYLGTFSNIASAQNTAPPSARVAPGPALSYGVSEVLKMYQGGINKNVILDYVNTSATTYHLSADGIVSLHSLGVPEELIKAMIVRDSTIQQQPLPQASQPYYAPQQPPMQQPMPPSYESMAAQPPPMQAVAPYTPPPAVTVIGSDYPYYSYSYYGYVGPYYGYGWPGWGWSGGWGWRGGWGYGGFRGGYGGYGGFRGGGGVRGGFGGGRGGGHR